MYLDECFIEGRVEVYTDGACVHNQSASLRRAGVGAWWAEGHGSNISELLVGHEQTNNRAELTAVLKVLLSEARPVHIKTDSKYVLDGCLKHRFAWAALKWHHVRNADLWKQVHGLLNMRGDQVRMSKVKGHATIHDVAKGRVSERDKMGNDAADCLAKAAAKANSFSSEIRIVKN